MYTLTADVPLNSDADLETILAAWETATDRLRQTHETLRDEVRRLTDELERKNRQLERKNRLADLGQMASHIAHEVRNSLVPIKLYLSLLLRHLNGDDNSMDLLHKIESGFTAMESTVADLLSFTSQHEPQQRRFRLRGLIDELCESLAPQFNAQGIHLEIDSSRETWVDADPDMIRRALLNLLLNALDAMPEGGELTLTTACTFDAVEIEVADSGPGIPAGETKRVFEPFYTTKSSGTGLGLAIVHRVAEAHGGEAFAVNCPQGGAALTIRIPQFAREAVAA